MHVPSTSQCQASARTNTALTVWALMSTTKELTSCCVLGNSLRKATTLRRVCFSSLNRKAGDDGEGRVGMAIHSQTLQFCPPHSLQPLCFAPITHLLGSLSFFTFLLSLKYSAKLLLGRRRERRDGQSKARDGYQYALPL